MWFKVIVFLAVVAATSAADCYWRGFPMCGLMFRCPGDDHFIQYGITVQCLASPDKYCCPAGSGDDIMLCEHKDFKGHCISQSVKHGDCATVDKNDWASSVDTFGNCMRIYEDDKCLGKSRAVFPGSPSHNNLEELGMNDMVSSVSTCFEDSCRRSKRSGNKQCRWFTDIVTIGFLAWLERDRDVNPPVVYFQRSRQNDRTEVMEAFIQQRHLNTGTPTNQEARDYAHRMGRNNDDAGHILAQRLGGSGRDLRNIFPQNSNFNRGVWAQIEGMVADVVNNYGSARFTVNLYYDNDYDTRPTRIVYRILRGDTEALIHIDDMLNP